MAPPFLFMIASFDILDRRCPGFYIASMRFLSIILVFSPVLFAADNDKALNMKRDYQLILENHITADVFHKDNDGSNEKSGSELKSAATGLIKLYQIFLSSQDSPVCNYSPSCSRFTSEAIQKAGFIKGSLLGADRLLRCHRWTKQYYRRMNNLPLEKVQARIDDPPERYID